jgi:pilus assembly protein CpaF
VVPLKPPAAAAKSSKGPATSLPTPQSRGAPSSRAKPAATSTKGKKELEGDEDDGPISGSTGNTSDGERSQSGPAPLAAVPALPGPAAPVAYPPAIVGTGPAAAAPMVAAVAAGAPAMARAEALSVLHRMLVEELGLDGLELRAVHAQRDAAEQAAQPIAERWKAAGRLDASEDPAALAKDAAARATDFEVIQDLLEDDAVHEVVVTHQREVWADREGQLVSAERSYERESDVVALVKRLARLGGTEADAQHPLVDVRLRDGSRVVACLPPLAFRGPTVSLRKSSRDAFSLEDLLQNQNLSESMMKFIDTCIRYRKGILLSVGPGVSASATLNALASVVPADERIVTVEREVELHLGHMNVTALEPSKDLGLAPLVHHAVALKPDRALIGLIAGEGTVDVLSAMSGALEGSICCYAAASPEQAIERLLKSELSEACPAREDAQRLLSSAVSVILQEQRFADGSRRITQISEVVLDGENLSAQDIFVFESQGLDERRLVAGEFKSTGYVPRFCEELNERGLEVNLGLFQA